MQILRECKDAKSDDVARRLKNRIGLDREDLENDDLSFKYFLYADPTLDGPSAGVSFDEHGFDSAEYPIDSSPDHGMESSMSRAQK